MAALPAVDLDPPPLGRRTFETHREVRVGDADRRGHLRLDALASYLQDIAGDDTADAGLRGLGGWVVRRSVIEVLRPPAYGQRLALTTWASGAGSRWAERRLSVRPIADPGAGAWIESVSLWVYVDPTSLRPAPLDPAFVAIYGPATGGRTVSSRFQHRTGADPDRPIERWRWTVRAVDLDLFDHVNNTATWAIVEEARSRHPWSAPVRAELEYRAPIPPDTAVVVDQQADPGGVDLWVRDAGSGALFATAQVRQRPG
jgi:acyl-ACP thioesterase